MKNIKQKLFNFYWKIYISIEYFKTFKCLPKSIKLTDNKNQPIVNGYLCAFKLKGMFDFENIITDIY
ncbi:hypothetical protein A0O34_16795 [Chryseobacterium glaciei]|uniref:Uncharacterized protein n=1 Tax=Chryseobacterium glaciei TaxID=1685010 RepID=A0A172XYQ5_9FLAO|nr:hypothetical protein [Chryseobacterium glaciei]ANF49314.1 hypothetical protein A0O34_01530 [Chryseobacterium glaciei]ANF52071.1 hypothetical protein A0O34_16795 [Chryseobacterium glaciei]